jgi:hypothetical protein
MTKFKEFIILNIILLLTSCGAVKEGFSNQKKNNNDEFLVEKKSPLVMPPNYNELPIPKNNENLTNDEENNLKNLISQKENKNIDSGNSTKSNKNFEESLLEKIKNN